MQKKGIAINTILLLVVGLIVVSILAYVVYQTFTGSGLSREECRGRIISWCTSCSITDFKSDIKVGESLATACGDIYTDISNKDKTCKDNVIKTFCSGFIPVTITT
jgi:hypothetical protein